MRDALEYIAYNRALIVRHPGVVHWTVIREEALGKRWNNACHHPEVATHPHHLHEGDDQNVRAHVAVTAEDILSILT